MKIKASDIWVICLVLLHVGAARAEPLNVVLIMADDIGVEGFGCYGSEVYATPRLDALAAEGRRFTHCYSQPLCTPSRIKLMTGLSNIRNYSRFGILDPDQRTIGNMLQDGGVATGVFGKWQLFGAEHYRELAGTGTHPRDAGFDTWMLWHLELLGSRYWKPKVEHDGEVVEYPGDVYGPDLFCEALCAFMAANRERTFFAYYPMALVHDPFVSPPETSGANRHERFADMVTYMDEVVGRIVDRLDELGLRERTLVMFTSDNGTHRSITSKWRDGELNGGKGRPTDAGTHVPLIVSCPGTVVPGDCDDLVDFSDMLPTVLDAAGVPLSEDFTPDGRSFLPQLRGEQGDPREWIFIYSNPRPGVQEEYCFVRDQRWKLYRTGELYDIESDPHEQTPVDNDAVRTRLLRAFDAMPAKPMRIQ